jgi:hypothetical protein
MGRRKNRMKPSNLLMKRIIAPRAGSFLCEGQVYTDKACGLRAYAQHIWGLAARPMRVTIQQIKMLSTQSRL